MKFSTREDIEAPIERVFAELVDFEGFERAAMRRGAEVTRLAESAGAAPGMRWDVAFNFRNRDRRAELELLEVDAPNGLRLGAKSGGMQMHATIELVALSPRRTRMTAVTEIEAHSIAGRLMVQSLKLARTNLDRRYRQRIADFADRVERRGT